MLRVPTLPVTIALQSAVETSARRSSISKSRVAQFVSSSPWRDAYITSSIPFRQSIAMLNYDIRYKDGNSAPTQLPSAALPLNVNCAVLPFPCRREAFRWTWYASYERLSLACCRGNEDNSTEKQRYRCGAKNDETMQRYLGSRSVSEKDHKVRISCS